VGQSLGDQAELAGEGLDADLADLLGDTDHHDDVADRAGRRRGGWYN